MKHIKILFSVLTFCLIFKANAQLPNLPSTHPIIESLKVSYTSVPSASNDLEYTSPVMAIPQATLTLKSTTGLSKIYFKILDKVPGEVIYDINYLLSTATVTDGNGLNLFENNNGTIFLSSGTPVSLIPYLFEVTIEDGQANISPVFTSIQ